MCGLFWLPTTSPLWVTMIRHNIAAMNGSEIFLLFDSLTPKTILVSDDVDKRRRRCQRWNWCLSPLVAGQSSGRQSTEVLQECNVICHQVSKREHSSSCPLTHEFILDSSFYFNSIFRIPMRHKVFTADDNLLWRHRDSFKSRQWKYRMSNIVYNFLWFDSFTSWNDFEIDARILNPLYCIYFVKMYYNSYTSRNARFQAVILLNVLLYRQWMDFVYETSRRPISR